MPEPRGRRHPLFLRLIKPIEPIYPHAVTPVAWNDDEPLSEAEGVVYIATRPSARLRAWARQLRKLHEADETYKTEEGISPLSAAPLREANLRALGTSVDLYAENGRELRSSRSAIRAYVTTDLLAVVTDRVGGNAVGFVSFSLQWVVDARISARGCPEFEVELDQAWMAPAFRRRCWGETAVIHRLRHQAAHQSHPVDHPLAARSHHAASADGLRRPLQHERRGVACEVRRLCFFPVRP